MKAENIMEAENTGRTGILLTLSNDEALILHEWISRLNEVGRNDLFRDQAEERVLFDLEAVLESRISETFRDNYEELLRDAWRRVRDREE